MGNIGTDIVEQLANSVGNIASTAVKSTLNSLFPRDFELYLISLELVSPDDKPEDYFTFPINPQSINKIEAYSKNIERTFGSVVVNKTGSFTPQDITIKGNFGKSFKILVRNKDITSFTSVYKKAEDEFSTTIKSGYGSLKVLQDICKRSNELVNGRPKRLYFHNFALGESYLVEVLDLNEDMNLSSNMIWGYTLRLKILSPINIDSTQRLNLVLVGQTQKTITNASNSIKDTLSTNM